VQNLQKLNRLSAGVRWFSFLENSGRIGNRVKIPSSPATVKTKDFPRVFLDIQVIKRHSHWNKLVLGRWKIAAVEPGDLPVCACAS
jgi:hypothetical protein